MLTRKKREFLSLPLTLVGQDEEVTFNVTYYNRSQSELEAITTKEGMKPYEPTLFIVKDWECEFPLTPEGVMELEGDRPGTLLAILMNFYEARQVRIKGN